MVVTPLRKLHKNLGLRAAVAAAEEPCNGLEIQVPDRIWWVLYWTSREGPPGGKLRSYCSAAAPRSTAPCGLRSFHQSAVSGFTYCKKRNFSGRI